MYHRISYVSIYIFGRLDIMHYRHTYVFRGALPYVRLLYPYIICPETQQYNNPIPLILFFLHNLLVRRAPDY
jgi:hypothetical protein